MNLVVQGAPQTPDELGELAALVQANHIVTLGAEAYRLTGARDAAAVEPWCAQRRLDFAWVPDDRRLEDVRLLAMDMDSTLVTIESIDEMGGMFGIREQIAGITRRAMRGEIDYREALRERVALLRGLEEQALERICEQRMHLSPGAETLVLRCRKQGIRTLLVSGGFNFFTAWLQQRLGIDDVLSNTLEIRDGRLTGCVVGGVVDGEAKAQKLRDEIARLGIEARHAVAIGDGANDIPMLAIAGVSVAYRARAVVREHATHALDHAQIDGVLNLFL